MANFINEAYYLEAKLKQCKANNVKDANGNDFTEETLRQAITDAGMTVESHYRLFGRDEGLQPNEYFNENEYLLSKLNQLNTTGDKQWTLSELKEAISSIGLIPAEHYEQFGCMEKDGNGHYINPSNDFDTDAYYTQKLEQLQAADESWQNKSIDDVANAIHNANMSPISHYESFGKTEAEANGISFIKEVPDDRKVQPSDDDDGHGSGNTVTADASAGVPSNADALASLASDVDDVYLIGATSAISNDVTLHWASKTEGKHKIYFADDTTAQGQNVSKLDIVNVEIAKIKTEGTNTGASHTIDNLVLDSSVDRFNVETSGSGLTINGDINGENIYGVHLLAYGGAINAGTVSINAAKLPGRAKNPSDGGDEALVMN